MPGASTTLLIDQGEDYTYPFTWETGSPPVPVQFDAGWTALAAFWDLSGVVLQVTDIISDKGQMQLIPGANQSPNIILHLTDEGTALMDSSGEFHLWVQNAAQDAPWSIARGQYKVKTSEVLP